MGDAVGKILPLAGAAAGLVLSGGNPAGAMAGYSLGSGAGSLFGGGGGDASGGFASGMANPFGGAFTGSAATPVGSAAPVGGGMLGSPGGGAGLLGSPKQGMALGSSDPFDAAYGPKKGTTAPGTQDKAQKLLGQLPMLAQMYGAKQGIDAQDEAMELARLKLAADAQASAYRQAPNPSFAPGVGLGSFPGVGGGFAYGR